MSLSCEYSDYYVLGTHNNNNLNRINTPGKHIIVLLTILGHNWQMHATLKLLNAHKIAAQTGALSSAYGLDDLS